MKEWSRETGPVSDAMFGSLQSVLSSQLLEQ